MQSFSGVFSFFSDSTSSYPSLAFLYCFSKYLPQTTELYHPPGEQQTFGENRFFTGDVPIVAGSRACVELFQRFR